MLEFNRGHDDFFVIDEDSNSKKYNFNVVTFNCKL